MDKSGVKRAQYSHYKCEMYNLLVVLNIWNALVNTLSVSIVDMRKNIMKIFIFLFMYPYLLNYVNLASKLYLEVIRHVLWYTAYEDKRKHIVI